MCWCWWWCWWSRAAAIANIERDRGKKVRRPQYKHKMQLKVSGNMRIYSEKLLQKKHHWCYDFSIRLLCVIFYRSFYYYLYHAQFNQFGFFLFFVAISCWCCCVCSLLFYMFFFFIYLFQNIELVITATRYIDCTSFDRFTFQLICSIAIWRSSSLVLFVLFVLLV